MTTITAPPLHLEQVSESLFLQDDTLAHPITSSHAQYATHLKFGRGAFSVNSSMGGELIDNFPLTPAEGASTVALAPHEQIVYSIGRPSMKIRAHRLSRVRDFELPPLLGERDFPDKPRGPTHIIPLLAVSNRGDMIAVSAVTDHVVHVLAAKPLSNLGFTAISRVSLTRREFPSAVTWSPDDQLLAFASSMGGFLVVNPRSGEETFRVPSHVCDVTAMAFSPDSRLICVASHSVNASETQGCAKICVFDLHASIMTNVHPLVAEITAGPLSVPVVRFLSSNATAVMCCNGAGEISVWSLPTGRRLQTLRLQEENGSHNRGLILRFSGDRMMVNEPTASQVTEYRLVGL